MLTVIVSPLATGFGKLMTSGDPSTCPYEG